MKLNSLQTTVVSLLAGLGTVQAQNLLLNPGFAQPLSSANWSVTSSSITRATGAYHDGDGYRLRFDILNLPANSSSRAYQTMAAQQGEQWTFSGWAITLSSAQMVGDCYGMLELVFTGSGPDVVSQSARLDSSNLVPGTWASVSTTATAPAGTTAVTFRMDLVRGADAVSGQLSFDDVSGTKISPAPEPLVGWLAAGVPVLAILVGWRKGRRRR